MYNFTLIKLTFFLIVGILLGFYVEFSSVILLITGAILFICFIISFYLAKRSFLQNPLFGVLTFCVFLYLGFLTSYSQLPKNNLDHIINSFDTELKEDPSLIVAEVIEILKPGKYQDRYILKLIELNSNYAEGKLLLNISKDSLSPKLKIGQRIVTLKQFENIQENLNPHQFNYSRYMKVLGVYKQLNISNLQFEILNNSPISLRSYAGKLRNHIIVNLKKQDFKKDELSVIQALLLGQRQELSSEIQQNYAAAGVIHILAVSGLHVGIILILLNWVLKFMDRWKYGKFVKTMFLLISLWGFALIAGLSPSVVRAVSMFSFVAIGMQLNRRTSIINTLFASLLILLLINPSYLFQVGFQLSYSAVFAIVVFQPSIMKIINTENKIFRYLWKIVSVTLAAQIGVLPLSLYYFHQFPGLFLLTNILILPFMGLILAVGIILILIILIGFDPIILSKTYAWMISALNNFVAYIASKEIFLIKDISFSLVLCVVFSLFLISISFLLKKYDFKNILLLFSSIILIQLVFIFEKYEKPNNELVIFHRARQTDIAITQQNTIDYYTSNIKEKPSFIKDYEIGNKIKIDTIFNIENIYSFSGKDILVVDSLGIYDLPNFNPKLVLLTNSPKLNLERLILKLKPEQIIADGSNYKNLIEKWKQSALNKKLPFHATGEKGAFIIKSVISTEGN
ncbi:ComEC/Rec2 family competence protein [Gillisia sp. CAL575]|uniref:ComEC/Rec2 family competence protein n=1 Tax=Gillisia sp. CAL575 TaxID=985255 RepID=UPI000A07880D|nr:ComEC/Rec2 family competence protein [Gillisia sp. CAL575]